jgi:hypothetical protein
MMTATMNTTLLSRFLVGSRNNEEMLMYHILFVDNTLFFCEANYELGNVGDVKGLARILGRLSMKYLGFIGCVIQCYIHLEWDN